MIDSNETTGWIQATLGAGKRFGEPTGIPILSREVRVQTADGQQIKVYLTAEGRLHMQADYRANPDARLVFRPEDVAGLTYDVSVWVPDEAGGRNDK